MNPNAKPKLVYFTLLDLSDYDGKSWDEINEAVSAAVAKLPEGGDIESIYLDIDCDPDGDDFTIRACRWETAEQAQQRAANEVRWKQEKAEQEIRYAREILRRHCEPD